MNPNEVDWESLENEWRFLLKNTSSSNINRAVIKNEHYAYFEQLVILVSAYEKLEELIQK